MGASLFKLPSATKGEAITGGRRPSLFLRESMAFQTRQSNKLDTPYTFHPQTQDRINLKHKSTPTPYPLR